MKHKIVAAAVARKSNALLQQQGAVWSGEGGAELLFGGGESVEEVLRHGGFPFWWSDWGRAVFRLPESIDFNKIRIAYYCEPHPT